MMFVSLNRSLLAGLLCLTAIACDSTPDPIVVPPTPITGFQLHMKPVVIQPGEDLEFCSYFNLDLPSRLAAENKEFLLQDLEVNGVDPNAEELAIGKIEVTGTAGLHHIQVLALEKDVEDTPNRHIFECAVDLFGGPLTGDVEPLFFTSQTGLSREYEPGVARILRRVVDKDVLARTGTSALTRTATETRGTQLLYNFHYLNPSTKPITAEIVVNLHVVPRETVVHPVRSAWWNYLYFNAKQDQKTRVEAEGSFHVPVRLLSLTSHQHEMGTEFTYWRDSGTQIYRNSDWSEPSYLTLDQSTAIDLPAAEPIHFSCEWFNSSRGNRFFGLQATDEMCTAIMEYYPNDELQAEQFLEMRRRESQGGPRGPFGGSAVSLEDFLGFPGPLVEQASQHPDQALTIFDRDIICGMAYNLKEMEQQYGMAPDTLQSLQLVLQYLGPICRIQ